jgi:hypothetical protein
LGGCGRWCTGQYRFLAAYTNKDPLTINDKAHNPKLNLTFSGFLPKPNWTVTYNGLSKLAGLESIYQYYYPARLPQYT